MRLIYIDDSRDEKLCVFSALSVPSATWHESFRLIKQFRHELRQRDGIHIHKELHAWKLVPGRGAISDRIVPKGRRCEIFRTALRITACLPQVFLFNAVFPAKEDERAFEWLLNRINRALQGWACHGILICDKGKDEAYTRLRRRLGSFNPIPSKYGKWTESGRSTKNIPIDRAVEDPFFKDSQQSHFTQIVDCCAYALLRQERPLESKSRYGLDSAFDLLDPILMKKASTKDARGIIRP